MKRCSTSTLALLARGCRPWYPRKRSRYDLLSRVADIPVLSSRQVCTRPCRRNLVKWRDSESKARWTIGVANPPPGTSLLVTCAGQGKLFLSFAAIGTGAYKRQCMASSALTAFPYVCTVRGLSVDHQPSQH